MGTTYEYISNNTIRREVKGMRNTRVGKSYVANSGYRLLDTRVQAKSGFGDGGLVPTSAVFTSIVFTTQQKNKLYSKLRDKINGSKGELMTSCVEWKTSLGMITSRATTIAAAFMAVKQLKFKKAGKILKVPANKIRRVESLKLSPTQVWLEYWMGWAPLAGDIGLAIETLTSRPSDIQHFSVGVRREDQTYEYRGVTEKVARWYYITESRRKISNSCYGDIVAVNHNYGLADKLGFTNPALTAWQLVPFSFIVDWFANVGQVLGSLTDFLGTSFSNTGEAMSSTVDANVSVLNVVAKHVGNGVFVPETRASLTQTGRMVVRERSPGPLPTPRLNVVMLDRLSLTRAATSVSLLREIFLRK